MKKLNILSLLFAVLLFSCEQEEFKGTGLESLSDFDLSPISNEIELRSIYPNRVVTFNWNKAESGLDSEVSYRWLVFDEDGSIQDPLVSLPADENGSAIALNFTHQQMDSLLNTLGVNSGQSASFQWAVEATNGDLINYTSSSSFTAKRFENEIAPFGLGSLADGLTLELDIDAPSTEIVVEWDSTYTGFETAVTYTWLAKSPDGSFDAPLLTLESDQAGADNQLTLTHQVLDDFLASQGLAEGEQLDLVWTVIAESEGLSLYSEEEKSISFVRFSSVDVKYLVGAATPGGWGWDNPTAVTEIEDGVYQATLTFANDAFRVFNTRDDWGSGNNFPYFINEGFIIDDRFENANDGDANFKFVGTPGEYVFTIDYNAKLIYLDGRDSKFMVGAATPSGWNWDAPTVTLIQVQTGVWATGLTFTNDAFRFFETEGDWGSGRNYPYYNDLGYTIDANFENANDGDSNFSFTGTSGYYRITLDTNNLSIVLDQFN